MPLLASGWSVAASPMIAFQDRAAASCYPTFLHQTRVWQVTRGAIHPGEPRLAGPATRSAEQPCLRRWVESVH